MDKLPVYPGSIPLDTNILQPQRNLEIALGFVLRAVFGTSTVVDGLNCTATGPASLSVVVAPGSIIFNTTVDTLVSGFGSLPVDNTNAIVKIGINLAASTIGPMTAPGTPGQSQNYLIQGSFSEVDGTPVVLPYYNAANPSVPYSGPSNTGAAQNTLRSQTVNLQLKAGAPATTGSQTTPAPDAGNVGLWVITIANGQTTITAGNIVKYPTSPFIPAKLGVGSLFGFSNSLSFSNSGTFTVPNGVTTIKVRAWGGGGGGGGSSAAGAAASGGGAGGYTEGIYTVIPGTVLTVTIGAGGAGGSGSGFGINGNPTTVGALCTAGGGARGAGSASGGQPSAGAGGTASGGNIQNAPGQQGGPGIAISGTGIGGQGGTPVFYSSAPIGIGVGSNGSIGAGGNGGANNAIGGSGGGGLVTFEW